MLIKITVKSASIFRGFLGILEKGNISYVNIPLNKLPGEIGERARMLIQGI